MGRGREGRGGLVEKKGGEGRGGLVEERVGERKVGDYYCLHKLHVWEVVYTKSRK